MESYAAGDAEAFEALFRRYEVRAYRFFLRRTGSAERSEDLYQELFLRIHKARARYDPARPFSPWFFQIASRLLVDDRRRAFRGYEVPIEDRDPRALLPASDERLAQREEIDRILRALTPAELYAVLSARVDGIGYPELAKGLGKSVDAVKKMVSRAIGRLRAGSNDARIPLSAR